MRQSSSTERREQFRDRITNVRLGIIGEFTPTFKPHRSTNDAIAHVLARKDHPLSVDWLSSADLTEELLTDYAGLWIAPGSPYEDLQKTVSAIQWTRENNIPCLGTCGGFQHMVIEYARNLLGFEDAQHGEYDPYASDLFISELECSLAGREMRLMFEENSQVASIYGTSKTTEEYYCNFGVNPEHLDLLRDGPLDITGADDEGEVRVIEHPNHPFYVGTLFVPQLQSTPNQLHPLIVKFLETVQA